MQLNRASLLIVSKKKILLRHKASSELNFILINWCKSIQLINIWQNEKNCFILAFFYKV